MLKIAIVDDEQRILDGLKILLSEIDGISVIASFNNPNSALRWFYDNRKNTDAFLLDIIMPEINGFELARQLISLKRNIDIAFITAYDQYAIQAFRYNAIDYLLKPVIEDQLLTLVSRLQQSKKLRQMIGDSENNTTHEFIRSYKDNQAHIALFYKHQLTLVEKKNIDFLAVFKERRGTSIYCQQQEYFCRTPLNNLVDELAMSQIIRCHRAYAVNRLCVKQFRHCPGSDRIGEITLRDYDQTIPVSKTYYNQVRSTLLSLNQTK